MKKYKQLTLGQRYQIQSLLQAGLTQTAIAKQLSVEASLVQNYSVIHQSEV